jgi:hypothetical protein
MADGTAGENLDGMTWADASNMVHYCKLPGVSVARGSVEGRTMKAVLWALFHHHGVSDACYPSQGLLAEVTQLSRSTVQRAVDGLEAIGAVETTTRAAWREEGKGGAVFAIVWGGLLEHVSERGLKRIPPWLRTQLRPDLWPPDECATMAQTGGRARHGDGATMAQTGGSAVSGDDDCATVALSGPGKRHHDTSIAPPRHIESATDGARVSQGVSQGGEEEETSSSGVPPLGGGEGEGDGGAEPTAVERAVGFRGDPLDGLERAGPDDPGWSQRVEAVLAAWGVENPTTTRRELTLEIVAAAMTGEELRLVHAEIQGRRSPTVRALVNRLRDRLGPGALQAWRAARRREDELAAAAAAQREADRAERDRRMWLAAHPVFAHAEATGVDWPADDFVAQRALAVDLVRAHAKRVATIRARPVSVERGVELCGQYLARVGDAIARDLGAETEDARETLGAELLAEMREIVEERLGREEAA